MTTTLAAAPTGSRVGFAAVGHRDTQLTLTVLPKAWRRNERRLVFSPGWPAGGQAAATLYETDRLHVDSTPVVDSLLRACLEVALASSNADSRNSALLVPDLPPSDEDLVTARPPSTGMELTAAADLLLLFDRLERLRPRAEDLVARATYSPLHRPLLYRRLLDDVYALANSARRGYRTVTSTRTAIRGQVDPTSVIRHQVLSDPQLVCRYQELTESTLLLSIVCTALDYIALGHGLRSPFGNRYSGPSLRRDAVALRRLFAQVNSLPVPVASGEGRRLRLSRLDLPWAEALLLSLTVLHAREHAPSNGTSRTSEALELSIPTDKLWESIVTQVLRRGGFSAVLNEPGQTSKTASDPWVRTRSEASRTYPDNVAWRAGELWVVDAKYKLRQASPTREDQYQTFAYSHLVQMRGRSPRHVALIYPDVGQTISWVRGGVQSSEDCLLHSIGVPFPSRSDVRSPTAWQRYVESASEYLDRSLTAAAREG
jgi:5-methylcytosine-specific restriction endonuclease McrBC regulatory subunit McrC